MTYSIINHILQRSLCLWILISFSEQERFWQSQHYPVDPCHIVCVQSEAKVHTKLKNKWDVSLKHVSFMKRGCILRYKSTIHLMSNWWHHMMIRSCREGCPHVPVCALGSCRGLPCTRRAHYIFVGFLLSLGMPFCSSITMIWRQPLHYFKQDRYRTNISFSPAVLVWFQLVSERTKAADPLLSPVCFKGNEEIELQRASFWIPALTWCVPKALWKG